MFVYNNVLARHLSTTPKITFFKPKFYSNIPKIGPPSMITLAENPKTRGSKTTKRMRSRFRRQRSIRDHPKRDNSCTHTPLYFTYLHVLLHSYRFAEPFRGIDPRIGHLCHCSVGSLPTPSRKWNGFSALWWCFVFDFRLGGCEWFVYLVVLSLLSEWND